MRASILIVLRGQITTILRLLRDDRWQERAAIEEARQRRELEESIRLEDEARLAARPVSSTVH
jgi:hypothetical protein